MRRFHLVEIEDQPWCPRVLRDAMTDYLHFVTERFGSYARAAPLLADALRRLGETHIVDLCSGGGGPWPDLVRRIAAAGGPAVRVRLTDHFPNRAAFARLAKASAGAIEGEAEPVDATAVPSRLAGFRTVFTALHHFRPQTARAILADAVRQRRGIGVFQVTYRSPLAILAMIPLVVLVFLVTPFIRPFRWSRLALTYPLPLVPLCFWLDATVSCLRTYTLTELRALTEGLGDDDYEWSIGWVRVPLFVTPMTYVIGMPTQPVMSS